MSGRPELDPYEKTAGAAQATDHGDATRGRDTSSTQGSSDVDAAAELLEDSFDAHLAAAVCGSSWTDATDSRAPELTPGTVVAGKYRIGRALGRGGMGAVYHATHLVTGADIALKWLQDTRDAGRMARESRAVGRLAHPNVVAIHDAGVDGPHPFLVMELLRGESLQQRILRGPLEVEEAVDLMLLAMRGVAAAHACGVLHRDLKPANIFLCATPDARPSPKILDFGISKLTGDTDEDVTQTESGARLGTPLFMAPEQMRGETVDERADVYSLAATLYVILTRKSPFDARTRYELSACVLTQDPIPASRQRRDVPAGLDAVLLRGMARHKDQRFPSVNALARALEPFGRVVVEPCGPHRPVERRRALLLSLFVLGFASACALFWAADHFYGIRGAQREPVGEGPSPIGVSVEARAFELPAASDSLAHAARPTSAATGAGTKATPDARPLNPPASPEPPDERDGISQPEATPDQPTRQPRHAEHPRASRREARQKDARQRATPTRSTKGAPARPSNAAVEPPQQKPPLEVEDRFMRW